MELAFIGNNHLSIISALATACKGFKVKIFFQNTKMKNNLSFLSDIHEPNLLRTYHKNKDKIRFSSDFTELKKCKLVFFAIDTLTDQKGNTDLKNLKKELKQVVLNMKKNSSLINLSQVPPGFTRKINWSKKNLYYQVETLVFGNAIERAINPERLIIGSSDSKIHDKNYYIFLKKFKCPIIINNYETAELTKISINMFLVSSITLSNSISDLCFKFKASWESISNSLRLDKRIGKHAYLKPNLSLGGTNLIRDINVFKKISKPVNKKIFKYFKMFETLNKERKKILSKLILKNYKNTKKTTICILGLSYKTNTNSLVNSPAIQLIKDFNNAKFNIHDPIITKLKVTHKNLKFSKSPMEAIKHSDILVICTPWEFYKKLPFKKIVSLLRGNVIIDPFSALNFQKTIKKVKYITLTK